MTHDHPGDFCRHCKDGYVTEITDPLAGTTCTSRCEYCGGLDEPIILWQAGGGVGTTHPLIQAIARANDELYQLDMERADG